MASEIYVENECGLKENIDSMKTDKPKMDLTGVPFEILETVVSDKPANKKPRTSSSNEQNSAIDLATLQVDLNEIKQCLATVVSKNDIADIVRSVVSEIFSGMKDKIASDIKMEVLNDVRKNVKLEIQTEINSHVSNEISENTQILNEKIDGLNLDFYNMREKIHQQVTEMELLRGRLRQSEQNYNKVISMANFNQQYSQKNNVKILKWKENKGEDLRRDFCQIAKTKGGIDVNPNDILAIHRVPGNKSGSRPVIAKFINTESRVAVMRKKKIFQDTFTLVDHVTPMNIELLKRLNDHEKVEKAWYFNGRIFAYDIRGDRHKFDITDNINERLRSVHLIYVAANKTLAVKEKLKVIMAISQSMRGQRKVEILVCTRLLKERGHFEMLVECVTTAKAKERKRKRESQNYTIKFMSENKYVIDEDQSFRLSVEGNIREISYEQSVKLDCVGKQGFKSIILNMVVCNADIPVSGTLNIDIVKEIEVEIPVVATTGFLCRNNKVQPIKKKSVETKHFLDVPIALELPRIEEDEPVERQGENICKTETAETLSNDPLEIIREAEDFERHHPTTIQSMKTANLTKLALRLERKEAQDLGYQLLPASEVVDISERTMGNIAVKILQRYRGKRPYFSQVTKLARALLAINRKDLADDHELETGSDFVDEAGAV